MRPILTEYWYLHIFVYRQIKHVRTIRVYTHDHIGLRTYGRPWTDVFVRATIYLLFGRAGKTVHIIPLYLRTSVSV